MRVGRIPVFPGQLVASSNTPDMMQDMTAASMDVQLLGDFNFFNLDNMPPSLDSLLHEPSIQISLSEPLPQKQSRGRPKMKPLKPGLKIENFKSPEEYGRARARLRMQEFRDRHRIQRESLMLENRVLHSLLQTGDMTQDDVLTEQARVIGCLVAVIHTRIGNVRESPYGVLKRVGVSSDILFKYFTAPGEVRVRPRTPTPPEQPNRRSTRKRKPREL